MEKCLKCNDDLICGKNIHSTYRYPMCRKCRIVEADKLRELSDANVATGEGEKNG